MQSTCSTLETLEAIHTIPYIHLVVMFLCEFFVLPMDRKADFLGHLTRLFQHVLTVLC